MKKLERSRALSIRAEVKGMALLAMAVVMCAVLAAPASAARKINGRTVGPVWAETGGGGRQIGVDHDNGAGFRRKIGVDHDNGAGYGRKFGIDARTWKFVLPLVRKYNR